MQQYIFNVPETEEAKLLLNLIITTGYFDEIKHYTIDKKTGLPNKETIETIKSIERGETNKYSNSTELFKHLKVYQA